MARHITIGAAQLGPIAKGEGREAVVKRLIALLRQASARGCELVVFPELALTTFFPRWLIERGPELDAWRWLLHRVCGAGRRRRQDAPLQHVHSGRCGRGNHWQVPQDPFSWACGAGTRPRLPASGEALF
ncbi:hypothetical protein G6F24_017700 [Rhizopus arrhizus]|nr:hypothetical protein G6F24_017700 [Rhizopus arrhizus]